MKLNIDEYNENEIIDLLDLKKKEKYNLDEIVNATKKILFEMSKENTNNLNDRKEKKEVEDFLIKCFDKFCNIQNIFVPKNIYNDFREVQHKMLLPNMNYSSVYQQNEKSIIHHENEKILSSFPSKYKGGIINPLKKQSYNYILNINSRFRNNYNTTSSSDFYLNLPNPIKNVLSMRLISNEIPDSIYQFSSSIGTNEFSVELYDISGGTEILNEQKITIRISNGNYTGDQLETFLNTNIFSQSPLERIECEYNDVIKKFRFYRDYDDFPDTSNITYAFNLDFRILDDPDRSSQLNMGWLLGYRNEYYDWDTEYIDASNVTTNLYEGYNPESLYNCSSLKYILLHVNDFNKNHSRVFETPFQEGLIRSNDILAKIPIKNDNYISNFQSLNPVINNRREYFGPVNIEKLEIRIYDEFGRIVDLNNCDYSFSLEIECLYDL